MMRRSSVGPSKINVANAKSKPRSRRLASLLSGSQENRIAKYTGVYTDGQDGPEARECPSTASTAIVPVTVKNTITSDSRAQVSHQGIPSATVTAPADRISA